MSDQPVRTRQDGSIIKFPKRTSPRLAAKKKNPSSEGGGGSIPTRSPSPEPRGATGTSTRATGASASATGARESNQTPPPDYSRYNPRQKLARRQSRGRRATSSPPPASRTGASRTGASRTGASRTGASTTGPSATGPSATGPSARTTSLQRFKNLLQQMSQIPSVRTRINNGYKPKRRERYMGIKNFSYFNDGLLTFNYSTNVRNFGADVTRQQENKAKLIRNRGEDLLADRKYQYSVFNSDPKFDVNDELSIDEILEILQVEDLKKILRHFVPGMTLPSVKRNLIEAIKQQLGPRNRNNRENYIRNEYSDSKQKLIKQQQNTRPEPNENMLVSNIYRYKKSHFAGLTMKQILKTLFDRGEHLTFLYNRVLGGKDIPLSREERIEEAYNKITENTIKGILSDGMIEKNPRESNSNYIKRVGARYYEVAEPLIEKYCDPLSDEADRIQKENSRLILSILFKPKNRFFLGPTPYTILNYDDETKIPQNKAELNSEFDMGAIYIIYDMLIHLTLSNKEPDQITSKDLQNAKCNNQWQKVRKNWYDIRSKVEQTPQGPVDVGPVFERKFHKPMSDPIVVGGRKTRRKNKKYKRKTRRHKN
jgi:hypothetical protein